MMRSPGPADTPKLTDTGITVMAHAWGVPVHADHTQRMRTPPERAQMTNGHLTVATP